MRGSQAVTVCAARTAEHGRVVWGELNLVKSPSPNPFPLGL